MKLDWWVRKGRFNWADPSEVGINIGMKIMDGNNQLIETASFVLPYEEDGEEFYWSDRFLEDPVDAFREAANKYLRYVLYSSNEEKIRSLLAYLEEHKEEVYRVFYQQKLERLYEKRDRLEKEIQKIEQYLRGVSND